MISVFAFSVWWLWVLVGPETAGDRISFIQTLGGIVGGAALISGLYFTARNVQLNARNLQVNQEGQITGRFTQAIDQLGRNDENGKLLEVRLGGIYALERIARDSERDHWPIMEVLTAYVRQHSPRQSEGETSKETAEEKSEEPNTVPLSRDLVLGADIQAIMAVIRRRVHHYENGGAELVDLHNTYLAEANLQGTNLQSAYLIRAYLRDAHLSEADLREAFLTKADLRGANLIGADLRGAYLVVADLQDADLSGANLQDADLSGANLQNANLWRTDLRNALLSGADLQDADLSEAALQNAWLDKAMFLRKDLKAENFFEAGLDLLYLLDNPIPTNLQGAYLQDAKLQGANLRGTQGLTQEQLNSAVGNRETELPDHLEAPSTFTKDSEV